MAPLAHLLAPSSAPAALAEPYPSASRPGSACSSGARRLAPGRAGHREHRAFSPPLAVAVTVRVGPGRAPLSSAGTCTG